MVKYSVFIPFYNEEKILRSNTLRVYNFLKSSIGDFELILVNDSSNDKSPEIAKVLAKEYPEIKVLSYDNGPSRRENLFWSFPKALGNIIAFTDLDLAVNEKNFKTLFDELESQTADVCIASRYEPSSIVYREWWRRIISITYLKTVQILFRSPVSDFQCGFKAFKQKSLVKILKQCGYDKTFRRGWFFDAEFLIRANKENMKIVAFPVLWKSGRKSSFNIFREVKVIPYLLKLWWRL